MRGCLAFFAIVARAIHHDRSFRGSLNMLPALAATRSSFQVQTAQFAAFVTPT
jgi:hypothetical protein